jgi:serine/threonine-protein kinase
MLEVGRDGDRPFFTMPFVKGWTLRQRLGKGGQLPVDETLRIARQLCAALAFAHERDVLHRDIKPENVLGAGESVFLMDFGIARALDEGAELSLTSSGLSLGTPAYMSPEQVCADRTLDARSDQYSLALVLYECLAGRSAFGGINAQAIAAVRLVSDPTPLELHRPDLPPSVARAIARALAREPEARFPHIESFERSLHDIS